LTCSSIRQQNLRRPRRSAISASDPAAVTVYPERTWRLSGLPTGPRNLFFVHQDSSWSIDLHLTTRSQRNIRRTARETGPGERAGRPALGAVGVVARAPPPALLLHLAAHAGIHLISLTLIRLTELVLVIRKDTENGTLSWEELRAAAERIGALGLLYPALSLCERWCPALFPRRSCRPSARVPPPTVVRLIDSLTPATAHGVLRCSAEERFMWLPSRTMVARQVLYDLLP
jgi:hypothetical protein